MPDRQAKIERQTKETSIELELNIDGSGQSEISTGIFMFDHLLQQVARHGTFDVKLKAAGDDPHHLIEDIGIILGKAFNEALGDKRGIVRMASFSVPMEDSLSTVVVDLSGRAYTVLDIPFEGNDMPGFHTSLINHFLESFANAAAMNLHAIIIYGSNDHHRAESLFKALGRALDQASRIDERIKNELPTTKGILES